MLLDMLVVGSVATTRNCTGDVGPEVVVRRPVLDAMFTFGIEAGRVLQVTESVMLNWCPFAVPMAINCSLVP